jgi:hypothetical protein
LSVSVASSTVDVSAGLREVFAAIVISRTSN